MALQTEATEPIPDITDGILRIVAAKTGYEVSDLDIDFELEADLGIDTVKQAEVFAVVRETYGIARDPNFVFGEHKSLRSVIEWAASRLGATRHALPSEPVRSTPPQTQTQTNTALVSDTVVTDFLTQAAKACLSPMERTLLKASSAVYFPISTALPQRQKHLLQVPTPTPVSVSTPPHLHQKCPHRRIDSVSVDIVCSGYRHWIAGRNRGFTATCAMFRGENRISHIGSRTDEFMDLGLVRLVKDPKRAKVISCLLKMNHVLRLAVSQANRPVGLWHSRKHCTCLRHQRSFAIAAAVEALRDAGIPLVRTFKLSAFRKKVPQGWAPPESMRRDTGIVSAHASLA